MNYLLYLVDCVVISGAVAYGIVCEEKNRRLKRENADLARRLLSYRLASMKVPPSHPVPGMNLDVNFERVSPGGNSEPFGVGDRVKYVVNYTGDATGTVREIKPDSSSGPGGTVLVLWSDGHESWKDASVLRRAT